MVAILNGFANDNGVNETLMITGLAKSFYCKWSPWSRMTV